MDNDRCVRRISRFAGSTGGQTRMRQEHGSSSSRICVSIHGGGYITIRRTAGALVHATVKGAIKEPLGVSGWADLQSVR